MKPKIIAKDREHLIEIIAEDINNSFGNSIPCKKTWVRLKLLH